MGLFGSLIIESGTEAKLSDNNSLKVKYIKFKVKRLMFEASYHMQG